MSAADHRIELEQLMAYLDGELPARAAADVRAHVTSCPTCQQMEAEMKVVSGKLAGWTVEPAPSTLLAPGPRSRSFVNVSWLPVAAALMIAAGAGAVWLSQNAAQDRQPSAVQVSLGGGAEGQAAAPGRDLNAANALQAAVAGQPDGTVIPPTAAVLLARTARLAIVLENLDAARTRIDHIVSAAGGFVGQIQISDTRRGSRSLSATLRVPSAALDKTLIDLKQLGQVTAESQEGDDVTQQSVDLDARLANARASEARLQAIMNSRTGKLSDVLDVEREISRVRGEIEQMNAERKSLDRRITYASITLELSEERKAAVDLGPISIGARFRNALVDGWTTAATSALEATLNITRLAPVLIMWTLVLALPVWLLKRRLAK